MRLLKKITLFALAAVTAVSCCCCGGKGDSGNTDGQKEDDMKKLPFYVDPETAEYGEFSGDLLYRPFFLGNVIYNETVLLTGDGTNASGKLQFTPIKVLSVRDYTWKNEYKENKDYKVSGNVITLGDDSAIPYLSEENLKGNDLPEPYYMTDDISKVNENGVMRMGATIYHEGKMIYGRQVSVSYVYDPKDINFDIPVFDAPLTVGKLERGEPVTIACTGDSIMEGCSTSGHFHHEPYMDDFMQLVKSGLESKYDSEITLSNQAVGGKTSTWGADAAQINKLISVNPDILFVHFGVNDAGANASKNLYADNIESIVVKVHSYLPDCEIVLIKCFTPHQPTYDGELLEGYWKKIDGIVGGNKNTVSLDLYHMSMKMLETKKYMDVTGNGINHLNDFTARLYAMYILGSLVKY